MPPKLYTKMRVIGGLTGEDLRPALTADWVILRHDVHCDKDLEVMAYLAENLPLQRYRKIVLDCRDTPYHNREDPDWHYYRTVTDAPPLIIFQKIKDD
jgi:hypothetical protein